MQKVLREEGSRLLPEAQAAVYQRFKENNELEPPHVPARSVAWLVMRAPQRLSGAFLDYDDPAIAGPALEVFGESFGG